MTVRKFLGIIILSILVLLLFAVNQSHAANHYIRAGATGTGDGSDWTNAWTDFPKSYTTYIAAVRGDTYYYADGTYVGWQTRAAGIDSTAGATEYVTIKKATVADHGDTTGWLDSYGDGVANITSNIKISNSCFLIDGQAGTGADTTTAYGFKLTSTTSLALMTINTGADSIKINQVEFQHNGIDTNLNHDCINLVSSSSNRSTNIQITECYLHDVNRTMILMYYANQILIQITSLQIPECRIGAIHKHKYGIR